MKRINTLSTFTKAALVAAGVVVGNAFIKPDKIQDAIADWWDPLPRSALSMGDYTEYSGEYGGHRRTVNALAPDAAPDAAKRRWQLRHNKDDLDQLLETCTQVGPGCSAHVLEFKEMLSTAAAIKDPLAQAVTVNNWVNRVIAYDTDDAQRLIKDVQTYALYLPTYTPVRTLRGGKGICDNVAELKLYALDHLGVKPDDVRFVAEESYHTDTKKTYGHAVVLLRIGNQNWVLNNTDSVSGLEGVTTHLNRHAERPWAPRMMPVSSANYQASTVFRSPTRHTLN